MIVSTFAILASLIIQSAIFSIFLSSGFYVIAKMMGFFLNAFLITPDNKILSFLITLSNYLLQIISSLIPRLDLFGQTRWLIYGPDYHTLNIIILQSLIYIPIIFFMAFYDFKNAYCKAYGTLTLASKTFVNCSGIAQSTKGVVKPVNPRKIF